MTISKSVLGSAVCLTVEGGEMVLQVEDAVMGISAVERLTPSSVEGLVPACGFNVRYLSEALERLSDAARVHLKFSDDKGESPVAVESSDCSGLFALVMPMRL